MAGIQGAGLCNAVIGSVSGIQGAGLCNVATDSLMGVQVAGFSNVATGNNTGAQMAGFSNVSTGDMRGFQAAGFINVARNVGGTAGFLYTTGAKVFGLYDPYRKEMIGGQLAGFCNVAHGSVRGLQAAGFANVSGGNLKGVQIASFINVARKVEGAQIGFINIADSVKGAPIGFLSFVRHGYHHLEVYASESMYGNIAFKTGVRHFYNILLAGISPNAGTFRWSFGYGIGSEFGLGKRGALNIDLVSMHINEGNYFTNTLNLLNRCNVTYGLALSKTIYVYGGPSFSVMASEYVNDDGTLGSKIAPSKTVFDKTYQSAQSANPVNVKMWPGLVAEIRF